MSQAFEGVHDTTLSGKNNINWHKPPDHHNTNTVAVQLGSTSGHVSG